MADTAKYTSELTDSLEMLTEDTAALYDSMDSYYPDLQATLDDSEELMNRITEAHEHEPQHGSHRAEHLKEQQ